MLPSNLGVSMNKTNKYNTVSVAWECLHCGKRHLFKWPEGEAITGPITMDCEREFGGCGNETQGKLYWIGTDCMAVVW